MMSCKKINPSKAHLFLCASIAFLNFTPPVFTMDRQQLSDRECADQECRDVCQIKNLAVSQQDPVVHDLIVRALTNGIDKQALADAMIPMIIRMKQGGLLFPEQELYLIKIVREIRPACVEVIGDC